jgi:hypothetical protein
MELGLREIQVAVPRFRCLPTTLRREAFAAWPAPVFLVAVQAHDFLAFLVRAALGVAEPHILLGRDVLHAHDFLLAGIQHFLGIDRPPLDRATPQ